MTSEQMSHVVKLREAREDGEREGAIAAWVECIERTFLSPGAEHDVGYRDRKFMGDLIRGYLLRELLRRFEAHRARIDHHFALRGWSVAMIEESLPR